jgi:hypothetical protein
MRFRVRRGRSESGRSPTPAVVENSEAVAVGARNYLFVSAQRPATAAAAVRSWAYGPPDLCVTSPSEEARDAALSACAGHFVPVTDEPLLARRLRVESADDFAARFAQAVSFVLELDCRAALVVCDDFPTDWPAPSSADDETLARRVTLVERKMAHQ